MRRIHLGGKILAILQGILSLILLGLLLVLNVLPASYIIIAAAIMLFLFLFSFVSQFTRSAHILGKILSVMMAILIVFAGYYIIITNQFLDQVTQPERKVDNIVAVVKIDDPAETIHDAVDYQFGILENLDRALVNQTIEQYDDMLEHMLNYYTYDGLRSMIDAFNEGQVQALIYNRTWDEPISDIEEGFAKTIKILDVTEIEIEQDYVESDIVVTQEPFIAYLSGVDEYGSMASTGRSDVNMLAVVNPETHQVLLVVTPRDYYVEFPGYSNGGLDKLTHAGNFGVRASMAALEGVYDITVDHYVRLNFTSFIDIIDALEGIEVYSEQTFITDKTNVSINEGYNYLYGKEALAFVRERYNLKDGDFQRGRNQQSMLTALIKKASTPAILSGYTDILGSLEGNLDLSMSQNDISNLVKMQLSDNVDWNIISVAALGIPSTEYCYSLGASASVVMPDYDSVEEIKLKINQVFNGDILQEETTY